MTPQFFTRPILSNIFKIFAYLFPTLIPFFSKNIGFSRGNTRYAVVSDLVIPILLQISFQNSPHHLTSLSVITCLRMPNFDMMWWKNNSAVPISVIAVVVEIKIVYFVSLSTITRILLNQLERGNSGIKSIETTSKG